MIKRVFAFLREDSKVSTTRVISFLAMGGTLLLFVLISFNIGYKTIQCEEVSWTELSAFVGALGGFNAVLMYGKVKQKDIELQKQQEYGKEEEIQSSN